MSKATAFWELSIELGNSAFESRNDAEIARILREIANGLDNGRASGNCRDYNGNRVGAYGYIVNPR